MQVNHLGNTNIDTIIACFLEAFEGYFVKMPSDYEYYKQRWKAAKVRFDLSYGMFENDKLVGFIINAVDKKDGENIAYNTGTGVIPEFRGQKITKRIYDYAIPDLLKNGITKCTLEVIIENFKAINSYKSIGFEICKTYNCFSGELLPSKNQVHIEETPFHTISWKQIPNQDKYSWDFNNECLKNGNSKYYYVYTDKNVESFFAINTENGTINQLEVLNNKTGNWERLFLAIGTLAKKVRIINVDDSLTEKLKAIELAGLENTVNQYEMELNLQNEA